MTQPDVTPDLKPYGINPDQKTVTIYTIKKFKRGMIMNRWLLKTEPGEYSFKDLQRDKKTVWDGVKAPGALKNMRSMKKGDQALIYHTGKEKAVVGTARIASDPYPDPEQENDRFLVVDIEAGEPLRKPVTLSAIKKSNLFFDWELVKQPRLSIMPVSKNQWEIIIDWGTKPAQN